MHATDIAYKLRKQHNQLSLLRRILDKCEMEYRGEQLFLTMLYISKSRFQLGSGLGILVLEFFLSK